MLDLGREVGNQPPSCVAHQTTRKKRVAFCASGKYVRTVDSPTATGSSEVAGLTDAPV